MINKKFIFYVEITKKCNLKCPFCPSSSNKKNEVMNFKDFVTIITKIKPNIELLYLHVLGEPFLHPNIQQILNYCNENNIPLGITTNGTIILQYKELLFKLNCLKKINISLQSLIQFDDNMREKYLDDLVLFLNHRQKIKSTIPINLRLWNDKTNLSVVDLNNYVLEKLSQYICENHNIRISSDDEFVWPDETKKDNEKKSICLGGKKQFSILTNGSIGLCCLDYQGKTQLGNLLVSDFEEILSSKLYKDAIDGFNNRKPYFQLCQKCTFRNRFIKK